MTTDEMQAIERLRAMNNDFGQQLRDIDLRHRRRMFRLLAGFGVWLAFAAVNWLWWKSLGVGVALNAVLTGFTVYSFVTVWTLRDWKLRLVGGVITVLCIAVLIVSILALLR